MLTLLLLIGIAVALYFLKDSELFVVLFGSSYTLLRKESQMVDLNNLLYWYQEMHPGQSLIIVHLSELAERRIRQVLRAKGKSPLSAHQAWLRHDEHLALLSNLFAENGDQHQLNNALKYTQLRLGFTADLKTHHWAQVNETTGEQMEHAFQQLVLQSDLMRLKYKKKVLMSTYLVFEVDEDGQEVCANFEVIVNRFVQG